MEHAIYPTPSDFSSCAAADSACDEGCAPRSGRLLALSKRADAASPEARGRERVAVGRSFVRLVPILPDELLVGYRSRLSAVNNCGTPGDIYRLMDAAFGAGASTCKADASFLASASAATGVPVQGLLDRHTMWPLFSAFPYDTAAMADRPVRTASFAGVCLRLWRSHLAYCEECVRHDLASFHFSYWHRSHQVPGLFHCPVHGTDLRLAPKLLLSRRPDEIRAAASTENPLRSTARGPVAASTVGILTRILAGQATQPLFHVQDRLTRFAFRAFAVDRVAEVISELVHRIHQHELSSWLSDLMPLTSSDCAREEGFLWRVLSPSSRQASATAIALTVSLLMSGDDGMRVVFGRT